MKSLMTGGMRESKEHTVVWSDVEIDVFLALYEFAFTGDYHIPVIGEVGIHLRELLGDTRSAEESESNGESSEVTTENRELPVEAKEEIEETEEVEAGGFAEDPQEELERSTWTASVFRSKKSKKARKKYVEMDDVDELVPSPFSFATEETKNQEPRSSESALWTQFRNLSRTLRGPEKGPSRSYNFNPLFHAKVYCLADEHLIESLKNRSLLHLHRDLSNLKDKPSETPKDDTIVLDLAAFAYCNTVCRRGRTDQLRAVVSSYMAAQGFALQLHEDFKDLLSACGDLGGDMVPLLIPMH